MERILIVNYGSSRAQDAARKVRAAGVFSEIISAGAVGQALRDGRSRGMILVGSLPEKLPDGLEGVLPCWPAGEAEISWHELNAFLTEQCGCSRDWNMETFLARAIAEVQNQVGTGRAVCGLSGGVDSAAAAALVHRAIGNQLACIYVDHGLMRAGESGQVLRIFRDQLGIPLIHVQAQGRFIDKLAGIEDPEEKRKIIGTEFVRVFEEEAAKIGKASFLVQGTLYPDVLESGAQTAEVFVKTHHNVGLPEDTAFELVEPLSLLFKDEVRELAQKLNLPEEIVWRHPFPGPGLAIRIMGEVTREKLAIVRQADAIAVEEIRRADLYREIWQALVVLTNIRTVGVRQGKRTYEYAAALRFVTGTDGMTADWSRVPYEVLDRISRRLMAEVKGINRVVYDISSKPPATIEWE